MIEKNEIKKEQNRITKQGEHTAQPAPSRAKSEYITERQTDGRTNSLKEWLRRE